METSFIRIYSDDKSDDFGFYFVESNGIKSGYIGTRNNPVLYKQEKKEDGKITCRTKGLSMGCFWSNWK